MAMRGDHAAGTSPTLNELAAGLLRVGADTAAVLCRARLTDALTWMLRMAAEAPAVTRSRSLRAADAAWLQQGAWFRTPRGRSVFLPGHLTPGAREMYCRNVYLRTGLGIPRDGWVVDLGANAGLFTVLAATEGARVVAVEAQRGFAAEIASLLDANGVDTTRVHVEVALAGSADPSVPQVGVVADDRRWRTASHADTRRPAGTSVPELMRRHQIDRIGLLKMDIEGSEFAVLDPRGDLSWLARVDQIAMEVHPQFGDGRQLRQLLMRSGFQVMLTNDGGRAPGPTPATYLYARRPAGRVGVARSRHALAGS